MGIAKKGSPTMPKKKKTAVTRRQALADVEKLQKLSKELELGLKKVKMGIKGSPYGCPAYSPTYRK
jgi:hypothetical protein